MAKVKSYKVVAVLWDDHIQVTRSEIPKDLEDALIKPSLSVGVVVKETDKCIMIISNMEHYVDYDDADYIIIYKSTIVSIKEFGELPLRIRCAP